MNLINRYCPDTHTHTHPINCSTWTTKLVGNECLLCTEPGGPATGSVNAVQYRQVVDVPDAVSSSPGHPVTVESPPPGHHYDEIADTDQVPASDAVVVDSADTEPKTPYDHLGPVPPRPTLPPVYLQLIDNSVEQPDVPTTSQTTAIQKRAAVTPSQPLCEGEGHQVSQ